MENIATTFGTMLGFIGPMLTGIGAVLLAYDMISAPARWYWDILSPLNGKKARKEVHESDIQKVRNHPAIPGPALKMKKNWLSTHWCQVYKYSQH